MSALLASTASFASTTSIFDLTSGNFSIPYSFTVTGPATVTGDTNSSGIVWSGVKLEAPSVPYSALDANPDDGFSFSGLTAGNYTLTFIGTGTGGYGGYYTITDAPAAVPEPGTLALLLCGLGLLSMTGRRRATSAP